MVLIIPQTVDTIKGEQIVRNLTVSKISDDIPVLYTLYKFDIV